MYATSSALPRPDAGCHCPFPQDELSAQAEVKKHQVLEQALADYAQTIHQLAASSQDMIDHEHPERWVQRQPGPAWGWSRLQE